MSVDRPSRTHVVPAILTFLLLGTAVPAVAHGPGAAPGQAVSQAARERGEKLTTDLVHLNLQYQVAAGSQKASLEQGMVAAAKTRKQELLGLMSSDPGEVLRLAVPGKIRASMPASVRAHVELEADLDGEIEVLHEDHATGGRYHYNLHSAQGQVSLHFAKDEPDHLATGAHIRAKGVQLDQALALDGSGSIQLVTSAVANTFGAQKTLVILVNFTDLATQPYTVASAQAGAFAATSTFDMENSYGQTWLTGDVVGWFTIPMSSTVCDSSTLASLATKAASAAGVSVSSYAHHVFAFPANACSWLGLGTVGGNPSKAWIRGSFSLGVLAHEMGHNLGLWHSHSLDCGAAITGGSCSIGEYGDPFDMMGGSFAASGHYTAFQKERLGWLNYRVSPPLYTVTTSGTFTIDPYETRTSNPKGLKIPKGVNASGQKTWYYVESRQAIDNASLKNGVLVHLGTSGSGDTSYLLDMTPETASWSDAALAVGKSYYDPDAGVTITPVAVAATGATIDVKFDAVACMRGVPTVAMSPSQTQWLGAGATATFTASVTNNDNTGCAPSTFSLQDVVPSGWVGDLGNASMTLAPGASGSTTLAVTSPSSALGGFYTVTVRTTDVAEGVHTASASATYVITSSVEATVSTNQTIYRRPGAVYITTNVRMNGAPVAGASVSVTVTKANGVTTRLSGSTDASGRAVMKMSVKRQDSIGTYQAVSKATVNGGATAQASTSFRVQ
jgi:hypothetical protein